MIITIQVPGAADTTLREGDWPGENPEIWARYEKGRKRRYGRAGYAWITGMGREDWLALADYVQSKAGAVEMVVRDNPGDNDTDRAELFALDVLIQRLTDQIPEVARLRR